MANLSGDNGGLDATMLVQPSGGYGYGGYPVYQAAPFYGGGFGGNGSIFGGDFGAMIALFFFAMMFGGFGGGWGMGGFGGFGGGFEFPWLLASNANNQNATQAGFNNAALTTQLDGIRGDVNRGFSDTQLGIAGVNQNICQSTGQIQNTLCQGFAGTTAAVTSAQNAITQQMYTNQIADMERSYAAQTASSNGMNNLAMGLQNCCYENRAATADLKYTVATENCADRYEAAQNTRDIIESQNRGTQAILDKLCALELDGVKSQLAQAQRENLGLQNQVNMATMRESQTAQTAQILAGQAAEIDGVYNRLKSCPVPSMPVYGNTPILTCPQNQYSPCGCAGNYQ
jgi:hypothetical protein